MIIRRALALAALAAALAVQPAAAQVLSPLSGGGAAPAISGTPTVGQVLSVPTYSGVTDQWLRNGVAIAAATSSTYTLVNADSGTTVSVALTLAGLAVTGGSAGGALDFSDAANSALLVTL